jgi:predicted ATPase/DNA-binding CsgD family transcriptional regulator
MSVSPRIARRPSPLPAGLTPLLGRDHESAELRKLLNDASNRLITLTGPGGVGKTRLALHVASSLLGEFEDNVAYVPLASVRQPNLVLPAIAQTFGMFSDALDAPEDQLAEVLRDERVLLALDNFEQVLGAAPSLANVLGRCPGVTMLVTSQAALGIAGEQLYPLLPLSTPSTDQTTTEEILGSDAVALFVQRARAVNPRLTMNDGVARTIAEICRKLDGLPLAIELAAARVNILSPDALLARLSNRLQVLGGERRGVPDRLRTMRNAVAWSYDLLTLDEQALFRRMSVFVGGISLDSVEAVCEPAEDSRDAYDVLSALVSHSLVRAISLPSGDTRFMMLETLRDYGLEQLEALSEEDDARLAHATCLLALAEAAEPHLAGRDQQAWVARLDPETENLRAAVDWALANGQEEIALRIGASNWRFCSTRGLASDCLARLEHALADTNARSPYRANALVGAGHLAQDLHDLDTAQAYFEQARALAAELGNRNDECLALVGLGSMAHERGDYAEAVACNRQAAELAHEIGDRRSSAMALSNKATVSYYQGRLDDAERHWDQCRAILAEIGDLTAEAKAASDLGAVSLGRSDFERAEQRLRQAFGLQRQVMASRDLPLTLIRLGEVSTRLGDYTQAHDAYAEALAMCRQAAYTVLEGTALSGVAALTLLRNDIPGAASLVLESMRVLANAHDPRCIIENAEVLSAICLACDNHAYAVTLMAAARLRGQLGADPHPIKVADLNQVATTARAALGDEEYARSWEAGAQMDLETLAQRITIVTREIAERMHSDLDPADASHTLGAVDLAAEHNLTAREAEVLRLLAQGLSTREIADTLYISPRTAATHITNILGKLEVTSRTAAVAYAVRVGLG